LQVFALPLPYHNTKPRRSLCVVPPLRRPTDDTLEMVNATSNRMRFKYVAGFSSSAGVILVIPQPASARPHAPDLSGVVRQREARL